MIRPTSRGRAIGWLGEAQAAEFAAKLARATSGRPFWIAALVTAIVGGAAAGLHLPTSGATFVHIATGHTIAATGLGGVSAFMSGKAAALDLRSWLLDLGLSSLYSAGGVGSLELLGAALGAGTGLLMLVAVRLNGRAHPLLVIAALGLALAALDPTATSLPALVLALLTATLMVCLAGVRQGSSWAPSAIVLLAVAWANVDSSVVVVVPMLVLFLICDSRSRRSSRPWALLPVLVVVASLVNPRGPAIYAGLPYSLGMFAEHPLLAVWSSPDFHPWGARLSELTALALLLGYLVAARSARRSWGYLALTAAAMALLWSFYLPLFLVLAGVQSASLLSEWAISAGERAPVATFPGGAPRRLVALAAIPVILSVGLLARAGVHSQVYGGPGAQLAKTLPVAAATWLSQSPVAGSWYTTPDFGDYLAFRFPHAHRLVCTSDPVADGEGRMSSCEQLAGLNQGALAVLRQLHVQSAVLPAAAPAVAFLTAEGWVVRYRDPTTVVVTSGLSSG
ncbi:MAG TPA: hypothetical protein VNF75_05970 [Candidatus Dormibacteraeota bacterium]|nr:hypothetical protein [Candidatus Dormibacteraeota bacterium]